MRGVVVATLITTATAVIRPDTGAAALFFLFQPSRIHVGDTVVVRTGGTPESFTLSDRARPFQDPIGLYLVPNEIADEVRSRNDPRLVPIGALVSDKNGHGVLSFRVPDLKPGTYAAAYALSVRGSAAGGPF